MPTRDGIMRTVRQIQDGHRKQGLKVPDTETLRKRVADACIRGERKRDR